MIKYISFDMDGTLVDSVFTDWVWGHGIPTLFAKKSGLTFDRAKTVVEGEYRKVGEAALEWYDIKYWFRFFGLREDWRALMKSYAHTIHVYSDVGGVLKRLKGHFPLILTSNAAREFIDVEMAATGLEGYFSRIFSATSDFRQVKKRAGFYSHICDLLGVLPQEIVHVGDHYEFDYLVPRQVGIHAFHLDRSGATWGEFVIPHLTDLEAKIQDA